MAERKLNSFRDQIATHIKKTLQNSLRKPSIAAVLLGLLLCFYPNCAFARSGGRIGGSAWSGTSSSSEPSYSYSAPSSSSSSYYKPIYIYSAPSRVERISHSYSAPLRSSSAPQETPESIFVLFLCFSCFLALVVCILILSSSKRSQDEKTSVLKLQVGMLGSGKTLQKDFNRLAEDADTSTLKGLSYVLTGNIGFVEASGLLHLLLFISGCKEEEGEKLFNQLSIEERRKFDEETLVNVDSIKRQSSKFRPASGFANEYIVVTILVAAKGIQKLQPINGIADLKETLQKLGSIPRNRIMAVEVLWTPQDDNEFLSEGELLIDYPLLRPNHS